MRRMASLGLGLLIAVAADGWRQPARPGVQVTLEDRSVVASGLTAGKAVIWFGVELRVDAELSTKLTQRYDVGTAAADGTARLDLPEPVAPRAYWTAVDLDSGGFAVATPAGYRLAGPTKPSSLDRGEGSKPDGLIDSRPYLMGLLVRPGVGAWSFAGGDGSPRDEDGRSDGHLRFALDKLDPLPGSPAAPAKSGGKDLWLIVDPYSMEISVLKGGVAQ